MGWSHQIKCQFSCWWQKHDQVESRCAAVAGDSLLLTLHSLNAVDPRGPLLAPDDPVGGGEEHVLGAAHRHPVHGELVCVGVPAQ